MLTGIYRNATYEEEKKEAEEIRNKQNLGNQSIPDYISKTVETGFSIPLLVYKRVLEGPTSKLLNLGGSILTIPDYLPIVGGLWKKTRSGTANILRKQFSKYYDKNETPRQTPREAPAETMKKTDDGLASIPEESIDYPQEDTKKDQ